METRTVRLAYGTSGLDIEVPADATVVEPRHSARVADPHQTLLDALRQPVAGPPLRELVLRGQTVAISMCDSTRPQPRESMLRAILEELDDVAGPAQIVVLVATGTHRGNTEDEIVSMVGPELAGMLDIRNHDARDDASLVYLGVHGAEVPVWLNADWVAADVRITTGFVEPHFFAGFSGGPKLVAPGLAGLETVLALHDAGRIGDPRATWGQCVGNPVHDDVRAVVAAVGGVDFALDVTLNRDQEITAAYGGELFAMHETARRVARGRVMRAVAAPFDVVVTTNAGFPLDQNLYQCVKGISAAANVVADSGTIICAAECRDGFPDHGEYRAQLSLADSPAELLRSIAARPRTQPDQWQVQVQARVQNRADVVMYTDGLAPEALAEAHLGHTSDISALALERLSAAGPESRLCVLPEGPMTIAYVDRVAAGA